MKTEVKMDLFGGGLFVPVRLWSRTENRFRWISLTFDTGASVTTISPEIFHELGYLPTTEIKTSITTASGIERVSHFVLDSLKIGEIEVKNIDAYAHKFPEESFSIGVIGLNVLQQFDIELSFSTQLIKLTEIMKGNTK